MNDNIVQAYSAQCRSRLPFAIAASQLCRTCFMPSSHLRRDQTVVFRRVGVGGACELDKNISLDAFSFRIFRRRQPVGNEVDRRTRSMTSRQAMRKRQLYIFLLFTAA